MLMLSHVCVYTYGRISRKLLGPLTSAPGFIGNGHQPPKVGRHLQKHKPLPLAESAHDGFEQLVQFIVRNPVPHPLGFA